MANPSPSSGIEYAEQIQYVLKDILSQELDCLATVSLAICQEVVLRHFRDIERIYVVHQNKKSLVHPSKHIAYLAYWVMRLKPIDSAFRKEVLNKALINGTGLQLKDEITDINERAAVYYAIRLLRSYIRSGHITPHAHKSSDEFGRIMDVVINEYFNDKVDRQTELGKRFDALVYDMRYRVFGPHHLVYIINHLLREAIFSAKEAN